MSDIIIKMFSILKNLKVNNSRPFVIDNQKSQNIKSDFNLINFHNPFNPSITIWYFINEESRINLSNYNSLGEKVSELINALQNRGEYNIFWNGKDANNQQLPSGIYLIKLQSDLSVVTKKAIKIK